MKSSTHTHIYSCWSHLFNFGTFQSRSMIRKDGKCYVGKMSKFGNLNSLEVLVKQCWNLHNVCRKSYIITSLRTHQQNVLRLLFFSLFYSMWFVSNWKKIFHFILALEVLQDVTVELIKNIDRSVQTKIRFTKETFIDVSERLL